MYRYLIYTFTISFLMNKTNSERRILNGKKAKDKSYTVYILKREESKRDYDAWVCGGAIVSPLYIVTSAACVEDVEYMYAIAGYSKYVNLAQLKDDECTKKYKKKIVYVCIPSGYTFDYHDVGKWSRVDIAVAKVESPYNFKDKGYLDVCTYIPKKIEINYEKKYQEPGVDAVALGWGHKKRYRQLDDTRDMNSDYLLGASVQIAEKQRCKKLFGDAYPKLHKLIDKYMICTIDKGNLDPKGNLIKRTPPCQYIDGCEPEGNLMGTALSKEDKLDPYDYFLIMRRNTMHNGTVTATRKDNTGTVENGTVLATRNNGVTIGNETVQVRKSDDIFGICQNDHGGPLVTWIGPHEVLIGVASVFRLNTTTYECQGPFLFTSTWCSSAFLYCIIEMEATEDEDRRRRNVCEKPLKEQGLTLVERSVSWSQHPDGPAQNEEVDEEGYWQVQMRPQISLNDMNREETLH